ncbi:MAG TPA: hypothetical protein VGF76_03685 [Polyangiaceae bacterium]
MPSTRVCRLHGRYALRTCTFSFNHGNWEQCPRSTAASTATSAGARCADHFGDNNAAADERAACTVNHGDEAATVEGVARWSVWSEQC